MAQLSAVLCVLDSASVRADAAMKTKAGDYPPVMLKCDTIITATAAKNGPYTEITLSIASAANVSSYLRDDGASGIKVGRFDLASTTGDLAAFKVENSDGSAYNLHVDDDVCRVGSTILQVGGTSGAKLGANALDLPTWESPTNPASGYARLRFDGSILYAKDHSGSDVGLQVGTLTATSLTLGAPLTFGNGGTGLLSFAPGALLYGPASGTALSTLAIGNAGQVMTSDGSAPSWDDPYLLAFTTSDPTLWDTPPTSIGRAIDNIASAVVGLLGEPIITP